VVVNIREIFVPNGEELQCPDGWSDSPWPECEGQVAAAAPSRSRQPAVEVSKAVVRGGDLIVDVPQGQRVSVYTVQGECVLTAGANQTKVCRISKDSAAFSVLVVRAVGAQGVYTEKVFVGR
jgi:hypothetical protein